MTDQAPSQPAGKGRASSPTVQRAAVELGDLAARGRSAGDTAAAGADATTDATTDPTTDPMHLARVGDVAAMAALFATGAYDATYTDGEGITPLHWAAINNQYAMCAFLLDGGAAVNAKGGESVATPLQWAAQRSHYYTVHLLLQRGADALMTDAQGYNTLHIATFNGSVLLLVLLLHQGIPVDVLDGFGHTGLMWAAYKGFPACVDLYLRWGASVAARDEQGFTALHWALVRGTPGCIQKLLEYGADRFAATAAGKTPAATARELHTEAAWHKALRACGYDADGHPARAATAAAAGPVGLLARALAAAAAAAAPAALRRRLAADQRAAAARFLFLWPFAVVGAVLALLAALPVYAALPAALLAGYALQAVAAQVAALALPPAARALQRTPWLAGLFAGSLFWVAATWLLRVLPATAAAHPLANLVFAGCCAATTYFYAACMAADPGFVPRLRGLAEQRAVIDDLVAAWQFDEAHFCVTCMVRTPVRSKHCRRCQRCVAKHDHHCPWVYNCVGVNNHRAFFLYLVHMAVGILVYDVCVWAYLDAAADAAAASDVCLVLAPRLCRVVHADAFTLLVAVWVSLQLTWVSMLLFVQSLQVARAMTTYENMYGVDHRAASGAAAALTSTGAPLDPAAAAAAAAAAEGHDHDHAHAGHAHAHGGFLKQWSRLLGVDTFIETATGRGAATSTRAGGRRSSLSTNPYSRGCVANCRDFWCDPAPLCGRRPETGAALLGGQPVNYTALYEPPRPMEPRKPRHGAYEAVAGEEV